MLQTVMSGIRQGLSSFSLGRQSVAIPDIRSAKEMRSLIEQERARVNRNNRTFAVILFELERKEDHLPLVRQLAVTLRQRVRLIDQVGWFQEQSVAVVLPQTDTSGAWCLVQDITDSAIHFRLPKCTVFTYPSAEFGVDVCSSNGRRNGVDEIFYGMAESTRGGGENGVGNGDRAIEILTKNNSFDSAPVALWKRGLDIVGSLVGLIIFSSFTFVIAIMIKMASSGPVLFKQERLGYKGKPFIFWKFRTMTANADQTSHRQHLIGLISSEHPMVKLDAQADPRIFPFGKFLRRTCLDELPQFLNVLRGEMSLVGPRPCLPYEAAQYKLWQTTRFDIIPGMTGLWQVSGKNGRTFKDMIRLDIKYVQQRSLWLDIKILMMTIAVVFKETGFGLFSLIRLDRKNG